MPSVKMKGSPYRVTAKGREYWYAWRNGPRLHSAPGTSGFLQELADAVASRHAPDNSKLSGLISQYRASDEFRGLECSTRDLWQPWLDKIRDKFGDLSLRQFDRIAIKPEIRRWHQSKKASPRAADTGLQAFSRVLSFGVAEGRLASNQCEGIPHLYKANRADLIWTPEQQVLLMRHASLEVGQAARLAALTGLRRGDLLRLSWNHIEEYAIELRTNKSRGRRTATVPLTAELRALLNEIPRRATTVLTSSDKKPWTGDGFGSSWWKTMQADGLKGCGLTFHDFRGTAATNFYRAGFSLREIAETLGWSEKRVERLIDRYVRRTEILQDRIRRSEQAAKAQQG